MHDIDLQICGYRILWTEYKSSTKAERDEEYFIAQEYDLQTVYTIMAVQDVITITEIKSNEEIVTSDATFTSINLMIITGEVSSFPTL